MTKTPRKAIEAGLRYLGSVQLHDGSFESFTSPSKIKFTANKSYASTFGPALILSALTEVKNVESRKIRNKLAVWIQNQRSPYGSYNYWAASAPERETLPYPDDLDDTFCALIGLYRHNPSTVDGSTLAQVVKLLLATETVPGGPYRTWLVPKTSDKGWLDVDVAVNANIARFLKLAAEPLPNLIDLIENVIVSKKHISRYYPDAYPILYYICQAYDGPKRQMLARYIRSLRHTNGAWNSPMHTALAVSSLIRLESQDALKEAQVYLLNTQQKDGSWPAEAFCIDPAIKGKKYYSGSSALSTAFALEALQLLESHQKSRSAAPLDARREAILSKVFDTTNKHFRSLDTELYKNVAKLLEKFADSDTGKDAVLLPYLFYASLKRPNKYNQSFFITLGLANLFGWLAYTIYDDFLDEEGNPRLLSSANIAMRESLAHFWRALGGHDDFQTFVFDAFNTIDKANNWEVTNCRFAVADGRMTIGKLPDWANLDKLADRSIGHALTPLAVLVNHGCKLDVGETKHVFKAMRHFLIARQLNDDLHDWQDDLCRGQITYVVGEVLNGAKLKQKTIDLKRSQPTMQKQFWHKTIIDVCGVITSHTLASRQALSSCRSLKKENIITALLDSIDKVNTDTLKTVADAKGFIKAYSSGK